MKFQKRTVIGKEVEIRGVPATKCFGSRDGLAVVTVLE